MVKLRTLKAENINKEDYDKLRRLCFRTEGYMTQHLSMGRNYPKSFPTRVFILEEKGRVLAWCIVIENFTNRYEINYYTRKSERGKGLAKRLSNKVNKYYQPKELTCHVHDEISDKFYENFNYDKKVEYID